MLIERFSHYSLYNKNGSYVNFQCISQCFSIFRWHCFDSICWFDQRSM